MNNKVRKTDMKTRDLRRAVESAFGVLRNHIRFKGIKLHWRHVDQHLLLLEREEKIKIELFNVGNGIFPGTHANMLRSELEKVKNAIKHKKHFIENLAVEYIKMIGERSYGAVPDCEGTLFKS